MKEQVCSLGIRLTLVFLLNVQVVTTAQSAFAQIPELCHLSWTVLTLTIPDLLTLKVAINKVPLEKIPYEKSNDWRVKRIIGESLSVNFEE